MDLDDASGVRGLARFVGARLDEQADLLSAGPDGSPGCAVEVLRSVRGAVDLLAGGRCEPGAEMALSLLARPFRDHPDFRPEW